VESGELIFLKRISLSGRGMKCKLDFIAPEKPGKYEYSMHVCCDGYVGLDTLLVVRFEVIEAIRSGQALAELLSDKNQETKRQPI
jgi:hypothetical protein